MAEKRLFCFGLGYSARFLGAALLQQGWHIAGTVRSAEKADTLHTMAVDIHLFDGTNPLDAAGRKALMQASYILSSAPPDAKGDPVLRHHAKELAANENLKWVGYLSTTGVYGDHGGDYVDETTPPAPVTERGKRRLAAENAWLGLYQQSGLPVHVFRLAGIYGPGRNILRSLLTGQAKRIALPDHVFSRIHVEDLAQVVAASMAQPRPGAIYNVCDDMPASQSDVTAFGAELLGLTPPPEIPFQEADMSDMARSFYKDNKRVCNRLIGKELGVTLDFPDYKTGLKALAAILKDRTNR